MGKNKKKDKKGNQDSTVEENKNEDVTDPSSTAISTKANETTEQTENDHQHQAEESKQEEIVVDPSDTANSIPATEAAHEAESDQKPET